jgi:hypothetical protein
MRSGRHMTSLRVLTWCCIIFLAPLTLLPGRAFVALGLLPAIKTVRSVVPAYVGHFAAYAAVSALAMAVYSPRRGGAPIIGGLWLYAGVLEYLQHFSPGRTRRSCRLLARPLERSAAGSSLPFCGAAAPPRSTIVSPMRSSSAINPTAATPRPRSTARLMSAERLLGAAD